MAKGYTQTSGIDYEETFSPVADIRDIRILKAIAAYYDYQIWQMDVKTAFLNGYLNEEVYMEQPEGFVNPKYPNRVELHIFLGITIYRDRTRRLIGLCQSAYIEIILKRYCMKNSKRGSIPMQEKLKLSKSQGASTHAELKRMQNVPYASAVGFIIVPSKAYSLLHLQKLSILLLLMLPRKPYRAIVIANESGITKGARHFHAKVHYVHEVIEYGDIKLEKVHTDDNLADSFTKALAFPKHSEHTRNIGMLPASSLICKIPTFPSPNGSQTQQDNGLRRHCILVAASNLDSQQLDVETVANSFPQACVSLSVICPKQLPKLKAIYTAGKRNPLAADPSFDIVRNPNDLVLISESFKEAYDALSPSGITNLSRTIPRYLENMKNSDGLDIMASISNDFKNVTENISGSRLVSQRSKTLKQALQQYTSIQVWDWLFKSCQVNGRILFRDGLIDVKDIEECIVKGRYKKLAIKLPAWSIWQCLLASAKSESSGLVI
nr:uncharacterized membrane protein At3g27390 isoform X1 [Tanacetum cinerariifolium]